MTDCFMCYLEDRNRNVLDHTEGELHACLTKLSNRDFQAYLQRIKSDVN